MAEPGRTQLQMMLVQQAGPGALPLSILQPLAFLPFVREVEQLTLEERLAPVLVYWSRHSAARLLPTGQRYRELMRDAFCVSIFSEDRQDPPDEWCFLIESRGLCLVCYGQQAAEDDPDRYQCSGSMDPQIVRQAFNRLLPIWQFVDLSESNRLEDARVNLGPCGSAPPLVQRVRNAWPVVKSPIQQNLILKPADVASNAAIAALDYGKINPIALDNPPSDVYGSGLPYLPPVSALPPQDQTQPMAPPMMPPPPPPLPGNEALSDRRNAEPDYLMQSTAEFPPVENGQPPNGEPFPPPDMGGRSAPNNNVLRGLRNTFSEEQEGDQSLIPPAAQAIISDIIGQLRHSSDLSSILQFAIENLTKVVGAERGLIWQVVGDQLAVTNEFATSGHTCFAGNQLGSQESTAIVLEFLSRFPDESGAGVISIPDTSQDTNLHKMSPTLSSLIELGEVRARLMVQLRSRGIFSGFLELQQCREVRDWSRQDAVILQSVAEMLSVVVQQSFDQSKIEMDAREMKLINEIASLFRESRGQSKDAVVKSVMLVAEHMGFIHSQIYLYNPEEESLLAQIQNAESSKVDLSMKDNPFVAVFESGRGKIVNAEFTRKGDKFFGHDMALILPLVSEGERLGVVGLWQRLPNRPQFRPQDRELGLTIAGHLSNVIRADQAIRQIRADQARAALINRVSSEIRQSLKEVDQIMNTLVESLHEYLGLALCVVSLYDSQTQDFSKSKTYGDGSNSAEQSEPNGNSEEALTPNFGEHLFMAMLEELKQGQTIFLMEDEIKARLAGRDVPIPEEYRSATLVPLVQAGTFKSALCMVSSEKDRAIPSSDMKMVADLADRVAVVVSHAELFAQVERQAITDPMTGLYNRRYFSEQLSKEIDRFQRFGHAFSLIVVDLDFLKKINDESELKHMAGDAAIKHVANTIKHKVRDVDTVGRIGGEEFVVLLPETDLAPARMVAERICAAIREKPVGQCGVGVITASLGVASFPYDAQDGDKLFELADQALFLAKERGRDQVCSVSEDLLPTMKDGGHGARRSAASQQAPGGDKAPEKPERGDREERRGKGYSSKVSAVADDASLAGIIDLTFVDEKGILGVFGQIIKAVEQKDAYGADRTPRAYKLASRVAQELKWNKEHSEIVSLAAVLSNLGKISVPEDILKKAGPLTDEEMEIVRKAPKRAAELLDDAKKLHKAATIIEAYRENWDGTGYPNGLREDQIPVEARIISLVDAYTAMTSDRPYRKSLSREEAIRIIQEGSGKQFDPRLVKIFVSILQKEGPPPAVPANPASL